MIDSDIHEILFQLSGGVIHPLILIKSSKSTLYGFASACASLVKVTQDVLTELEDFVLTPSATAVLQVGINKTLTQSGRCKFADHIPIMSR